MTSTEMKQGLTINSRPSSRVLKPPGGGHSNIFADPEVSVNAPRPKYNQQNSSNLNACMGSTDPNQVVEKLREEITHAKDTNAADKPVDNKADQKNVKNGENNAAPAVRGRVPPGGYSSGGFW